VSFPVASAIESASAGVMMLGIIFATGRFSAKVDENTRATDRLTKAFSEHAEKTDGRLNSLEVNMALVQSKLGARK
jgi:hypothetical protein